MSNRLIRDGILESEAVLSLPAEARWLYVSILLSADDVGLFEATPFRLARRADVRREMADKLVRMLADADLVRLYEVDGKQYGFIPKFCQRLQIKRIKHPAPPLALMQDDQDATNKIKHLASNPTVDHGESPLSTVGQRCEPEPEPKNEEQPKSKTKTARQRAAPAVLVSVAEMVADGVDKQSATDWLVARKTKSLPLTPTAWAETKSEAVKANMTVSEAVRIAAGNGWAGFKAKWLIDAKTSVETKTSFTRDREAAAARWIGSAKLSGSRGSFIDMESADVPAHAIR